MSGGADRYKIGRNYAVQFAMIQEKIESLFEQCYITYPGEAEFIEAMIRMTESRNVLELGMYSGFGTLHMIRAVYPSGMVTSVDMKPAHDREFFDQPFVKRCFRFVEGRTPEVLAELKGNLYDLVFIDSDHGADHTERERIALWEITRSGTVFLFHDCPPGSDPYSYLYNLVQKGVLTGAIFETPQRLDVPGPKETQPHMGVFVRV